MVSHLFFVISVRKHKQTKYFYGSIIWLAVSSVESQVDLPCPATELCAGSTNDGELTCTASSGKTLI